MGVGEGTDEDAAADPGSAAASFDARLPLGWGVARTKKAILQSHPVLKEAWGRRLGYRLMFVESEILSAVLLHLASQGIPALGLHDGLMVAMSGREKARETLIERAREVSDTT